MCKGLATGRGNGEVAPTSSRYGPKKGGTLYEASEG